MHKRITAMDCRGVAQMALQFPGQIDAGWENSMSQLKRDAVKRALADAGEVGGGTIDAVDMERIRAVYAEKDPAVREIKRVQLLEELIGRADSASSRLAAELSSFGLDFEAANRFLQGEKLSTEARTEIDGALQASADEAERAARDAVRAVKDGPRAGRAPRAGRLSV